MINRELSELPVTAAAQEAFEKALAQIFLKRLQSGAWPDQPPTEK